MRHLFKTCFLLMLLSQGINAAPQSRTEISALAWPALSPNGEIMAFEWLNDLWLASIKGGEAKRIVMHPSREAYPRFTPDGERLVFSSERSGSAQVYSVKLDGSDLKKHSDNTQGSIVETVSPDGSYALIRGERERSGYKPSRILKVDLARESRELLLFDATAHSVSISPDGEKFLFCRGGEQMYRNGYEGSRASQIYLYDKVRKSFESIITGEQEARSPLWCADGESFYYVSGRSGVLNIWQRTVENQSERQLTFFKEDGVVLPAISEDRKVLVFRAGQKIYRFYPGSGKQPEEIQLFTEEQVPNRSIRKEKVTGTSDVAFFPNKNQIIFSSAGELWMATSAAVSPKQLTETDRTDEREPVLSPDGRTLFFLKDDGLEMNVCRADCEGSALGEVVILPTNTGSKRSLRISPDGSLLSWLESTGDLVTAMSDGSGSKVIMKNWDMPTYDWSPDGKWLVVAAKDIHANRDIYLVPADGSRAPFNLTFHPAFDGSPKWSPNGRKIVFVSRRVSDGLARLMIAEVGKFLEQPELRESELQKIADTIRPVSTDISEPIRVVWSADSAELLFQSRDTSENTIFSVSSVDGKVSEFADFRGIPVGSPETARSFWRIDRIPSLLNESGRVDFPFSFSVEQDRSDRLRLGFRRIWRTLSERFYDETMNGKDWPRILQKYEDAAAGSFDSRQFDRVVAQLLGELNASHLTFKTKPWGVSNVVEKIKKATAHPGLVFRNEWDGSLVIERIIKGTPISRGSRKPEAGERVLRIAGKNVDASTPLGKFLNGAKNSPLPIVIGAETGEERTLELIPVSYDRIRQLDAEERESDARENASSSDHAIVYLPFKRMKSDELHELSTEVYRASLTAEGLILDLRDNAGGRVADQLLGLFCQPAHTFTIPRGGERGYPTDRRVSPSWDGPMVVICNENTFSNAEIFCHAFSRLGRGKLVGMPTNGGVISAVGITIPEVGELQIPFRGWFDIDSGRDLELNGAKPDALVPLLPSDQVAGRDPQLEAAIGIINGELSRVPPEVKPVYKSAERSGKQ